MISDHVSIRDSHVYRNFKLLTGGDDKVLDALHICYRVLSELQDGADIEANLQYLITRFSVQLPSLRRRHSDE